MAHDIKCRECGESIFFVKTENGKQMPCDRRTQYYKHDPHGPDTLILPDGRVVRCRIDNRASDYDGEGYIPHFATCRARQKKKNRSMNGQLSFFDEW